MSDSGFSTNSDSSTTCATKQKKNSRRRKRTRGTQKKQTLQPPVETPLDPEEQEQEQFVAMDCEMVGVGAGGFQSAIARVTIINWNGQVLLDEFIQPDREVVDYRTFVSGVQQSDLENAMDMDTCRTKVTEILDGKILIGHALKNDLNALGIQHPWQTTRDTAKYEPFMKVRFDDGILWPRKLRELCQEKLDREIQTPGRPHSAYEDAIAALDLYKKVRSKWEKVMEYKISRTHEIEASKREACAE